MVIAVAKSDVAAKIRHCSCIGCFLLLLLLLLPLLKNQMAWLGFFITSMERPGFEPMSVELHCDPGPLKDALPTELPRHGRLSNIFPISLVVLWFYSLNPNIFVCGHWPMTKELLELLLLLSLLPAAIGKRPRNYLSCSFPSPFGSFPH